MLNSFPLDFSLPQVDSEDKDDSNGVKSEQEGGLVRVQRAIEYIY